MNLIGKFAPAICMILLSACAQTLPIESRYPTFDGTLNSNLSVAVTDHREFILNGDKEPWFEGIMHGVFGIPISLERNNQTEESSFARYLASMIQESLEKAGSKVSIVDLPIGETFESSVKKMIENGASGILVVMRKSRYSFWLTADYQYDFDVAIVDSVGNIKARKTFAQWDKEIPLSSKYSAFDMFTEIYSNRLQIILNDADIKSALKFK